VFVQVDDGTDPNLTELAADFLALDEEDAKEQYVRPFYADVLGLPEF
jgi:hypothetical protein